MRTISIALLTVASLALAGSAFAQKDKDDKPGHGRGGPPGAGPPSAPQSTSSHSSGGQPVIVISDRDRNATYSYYRTEYVAGRCPPGLAKKNNGCLPPGQAKRVWAVGQPLPSAIVYYPLPTTLVTQLSPPPRGYDYVQVDNDVVLMELGNRMVVDIVADLSSFD